MVGDHRQRLDEHRRRDRARLRPDDGAEDARGGDVRHCLLSCAVSMAMATFLEVFTTLGEERRRDHEAGLPPRSGWLRRGHQPSAPTSPPEPRELATVPPACPDPTT